MSDKDVKCPRCKCYRTEDDFLKNGRRLKSCINCRNNSNNYRIKNKCPHYRQKAKCFDCGGIGICEHNRLKYRCIKCSGSDFCEHKRIKSYCVDCGGSEICIHNKQRCFCKTCSGPVKVSIRQWIMNSKESDKKYNRFDIDRFIDRCFLKELVKDYTNCYYCEVELQYVDNNDTLSTIERLDNTIGHIKSNCVLSCRKCNLTKVGQRKINLT